MLRCRGIASLAVLLSLIPILSINNHLEYTMKFRIAYALAILLSLSTLIATGQSLGKNFLNPPLEARAKALWTWTNGNFNYEQIRYELQQVKDKGMGGLDIWDVGAINRDRMPAGPPFLSDESMAAIAFTIDEATKLGLEIGLITSSSWNAGGQWIKPEDGVFGLFQTTVSVKGPSLFNGNLPVPRIENKKEIMGLTTPLPPTVQVHKDVVTTAVNVATKQKIDLTDKLNSNGNISWQVPEGEWTIHRLVAVTTGQLLEVPSSNSVGLMLDHYSAQAQRANLDYVIGRLKKYIPSFRGTALKYLYVDSYEANSASWTPTLPEAFLKLRGYDPKPYFILLQDSTAYTKEIANRFYYDFNRTLSDLIIENHYKLGREICEPLGLGYYAEAAGPGKPVHNCPFESLRSSGELTVPRGEFWLGMDSRTDADGNSHLDMIKGVASASHIYNRKYVEAESFTQVPMYTEDFNLLKKYVDNSFCDGLNRIVLHTFQHNAKHVGTPGSNYPFGTVFGTFQPWWDVSRGWFDYLARASYLLQQGNFVADVLYYYGDQAPNFVKESTIKKICGPGYDFDAVNTDILLNKIEFKDGFLKLPHGQQYKVLVLADQPDMQPEVLEKIEKLVKAGAIVIGTKPQYAPGLFEYEQRTKKLKQLASELWGKVDGKKVKENNYGKGKVVMGKKVAEVLTDIGMPVDFKAVSILDSSTIRYIHRKGEQGEEIYFISNQKSRTERIDVSFRTTGKIPEHWDLMTGETKPLTVYKTTGQHTTLPLTLPAYGSVAIVFNKTSDGVNHVQGLQKDGVPLFPIDTKKTSKTNTESWRGETVAHNASLTYKDGSQKKMNAAPTETVNLNEKWKVNFPFGHGAPTEENFEKLLPLTNASNPGIKYFSGVATYQKSFTLNAAALTDKKITLDLGQLKDMAEVFVNGKHAGYCWSFPYTLDISKLVHEGENTLLVNVGNGLNNRQVGDGVEKNARPYTYSNIDKGICAWCKPWGEAPLHPAGLLGPVRITIDPVAAW